MKTLIAALAFLFGLPVLAQSEADWKQLVEAAKKEGTLVIAGPPTWRRWTRRSRSGRA